MAFEDSLPDRLRETYSVKIGLIFVAIALVTLLVSAIFFAHVSGAVGPEAEQHFGDRTDDRSDVAETWLETNAETTNGLAADATVRDGDTDAIADRLADARAARDDRVAEIHYLAADGEVLASSDDAATAENFFDAAGVDGETDGPTAAHRALSSDDEVLSFVASVPGEDRYVALSAPVTGFASTLESGDDYRTVVTGADGERIVGVGELSGDVEVDDAAVLEAVGTDASGVVTATPEGTDRELAATTATIDVGESTMGVMTYGVADDVFVAQNTATAAIATLAFIFVINLGFVAIVLGGNLSLQLRRLAQKAERMGDGDLDVDLETDRIDEVGILYNSFGSMRDNLSTTLADLEDERERAREAQRRTEQRNRELEAEAERFGDVMADCADGDLQRRLEPETDHEAMVEIAESFNEMIADLETTVSQVKRISRDVARTSTEVQSSSEEISRASEEVSASVQEISDGSSAQADDLETATTEVKEMSATVEEVAAATSTIADQSTQVDELATAGQEAAEETTAEMHDASDKTETVAETIHDLEQEAEQIQEIVELIDEIAGQTNMLALNAAIESARSQSASSEDGGFQAVADEVKELAEQTQAAVDDVEAMIESIQQRATESAAQIEETEETIGSATDRVDSLADNLDRIAREIEQVASGVTQIDQATNEQSESAEELATIVQDVASVANETTSQAQQVAAASEETTATITDVSAEATRLDQRATELADAVDEFAVSGADADAQPPAAEHGGESR
ncbi:methyl-accepting chemotaxis sensory transducer [Haloterrigena salina JCM 13891]|uniref:Methyl-accepting chemotaxis sensory transducer n=1 Tax=Haloterrigena salina JCM 13891 TaxID=1227488 RepID=M0CGI2_9EURY|nr:methyl-accepting chemotaxis sensory transducer [Haloterrigena salina JCM 13891]